MQERVNAINPPVHICGRCKGTPAPFGYRLQSGTIWSCSAHKADAERLFAGDPSRVGAGGLCSGETAPQAAEDAGQGSLFGDP